MTESTVPNVTLKDTKATILSAYNSVFEKLSEYQSTSMNPKQKIADQMKEKTIDRANNLNNLVVFVSNASNLITKAMDDFKNINDAIAYKKEEIKNLFDIETECLTLAALVDSNEELKRQFDEESKLRRTKVDEEIQRVKSEIDEAENEAEKERKRQTENWEYDFDRKKKEELDSLNDNLTKNRKNHEVNIADLYDTLNQKQKEANEREVIIQNSEQELSYLRDKIESMPDIIATEVKAKVGKEKGMLENRLEQEKKYFERDISAKLEMALSQTSTLSEENTNLKIQIDILNTKLENAYKEVKEISIKTVEGAGNSQMFSEMKTLLKDRNNSK